MISKLEMDIYFTTRNSFLNQNIIPNGKIREIIKNSWLRSKNYNVDPNCLKVPYITKKNHVLSKISDQTRLLRNRFIEQHNTLTILLEQIGAAVFCLNSDMEVFDKSGNTELLNELKEINIKFGTCFSENIAGTNAAALAYKMNRSVWTIGHEHYIEAFTKYAFLATSPVSNKFYNMSCFLLVVPLEKLNSVVYSCFEFAKESINISTNYSTLPDVFIKSNLLDETMKRKSSMYLITNDEGLIIDADRQIHSLFNTSMMEIGGKPIDMVFPDLAVAMECLRTGKEISMKNIIFQNLPTGQNEYLLDCKTMADGIGERFGMILILTNRIEIQKYISKVANKNPYFTFAHLLGDADIFRQVKQIAKQAAENSSSVLILGESGTGKELFAQAIHNASSRKNKPFVPLNCAAIPKELIGSELFGYTEGAFTGAKKSGAPGKFELADGGTLFLDEIAEMPLDMQSVLLRVLEDNIVTRLGASNAIAVNVRIIAATNRNLWEYVNNGKFRLDLYFRLNVIKLELPPLRERSEDIPLLVGHFLESFSASFRKNVTKVSPEVMEFFTSHEWYGNIRELRNIIERSVNIAKTSELTINEIPSDFFQIPDNPSKRQEIKFIKPEDTFRNYNEYEKGLIRQLLIKHKGNKTLVAKDMGISRKTLYQKIKAL